MIPVLQIAKYGFWWAGLLPLAAVAWLGMRRKLPELDVVILAVAFALSFAFDLFGKALFDRGVPNQWLTYCLAPIQFGLVMTVVAPAEGRRIVWGFFLVLVALSVLRGPWQAPEAVVQVVGGLWIGLVVYRQPALERYRLALLVYFVAAVPFLLPRAAMVPSASTGWLSLWAGYELVRVLGLSLFTIAVLRPRLRLEVADARDRGIRRGHRGSGRRLGLVGGRTDRAVSGA